VVNLRQCRVLVGGYGSQASEAGRRHRGSDGDGEFVASQ
jgi:hypothetical protein